MRGRLRGGALRPFMPSDKGGLGRTGNKHKRKKAPPAPCSEVKEAPGPRGQRPGLRSAVTEPPERCRRAASPPSRLQVMFFEALDAARAAEREQEMAEARWTVAVSVHERKVEIAEKNMAKIVRMQEPLHPPLVVNWEAVLQALREQKKLHEAASRAGRVQEDLRVECEVATDNYIALLANAERC